MDFPGFIPFKGAANQVGVETRICLAESFHCMRQLKQPPRCCLLKESDRSNDRKPATNGRSSPGPVVN